MKNKICSENRNRPKLLGFGLLELRRFSWYLWIVCSYRTFWGIACWRFPMKVQNTLGCVRVNSLVSVAFWVNLRYGRFSLKVLAFPNQNSWDLAKKRADSWHSELSKSDAFGSKNMFGLFLGGGVKKGIRREICALHDPIKRQPKFFSSSNSSFFSFPSLGTYAGMVGLVRSILDAEKKNPSHFPHTIFPDFAYFGGSRNVRPRKKKRPSFYFRKTRRIWTALNLTNPPSFG